jgi:hypothetical protein
MGFHDRARMLKALATYLNERKEPLYACPTAPVRPWPTTGSTSMAASGRCS